jgi:hypothetical protein
MIDLTVFYLPRSYAYWHPILRQLCVGKDMKEGVVAYLKAAHQNLAEGTQENHANLTKKTKSGD